MSIEIKDCDGGIGVVIEFRGIVTDKEYVDAFKSHLTQDKDKFKKYKYSLNDTGAIEEVHILKQSVEYISELCVAASKIIPDPVVAMWGASDIAFGLQRMAEAIMSPTDWEMMTFRSREQAVEWIKERVKDKFGIDDLTLK